MMDSKPTDMEWGGEEKIEINEGEAEQLGETVINVAEKATRRGEALDGEIVQKVSEQMHSFMHKVLIAQESGEDVGPDVIDEFDKIKSSYDETTLKEVMLSLYEDKKLVETGLLSSICDGFGVKISLDDILEHKKEEPFVVDKNEMKSFAHDFMDGVMLSSGRLSNEQLDTLRRIKERGYRIFDLIGGDAASSQFDDNDYSLEQIRMKKRGRDFYDVVSRSGLVDDGELLSLYESLTDCDRHYLCNDDYMIVGMIDAAIADGKLIEFNNEGAEYWQKLCQEKGAETILKFRQKIVDGKLSVFEDYDFNEPAVKDCFIRSLRSLNYDNYGNNRDNLISSEWSSRLLDDDECLRKMVMEAQRMGEDHGRGVTALQALLVRDRSVVDRIAKSNILEENPYLLQCEIFRKIHDGSFSEKERLGIFFNLEPHGGFWGAEISLDENGACRDVDAIELTYDRLARICVLDKETRIQALRKYYRNGNNLDSLAWCDLNELNEAVELKPQEVAYIELLRKTDWPLELQSGEIMKCFDENGLTLDFCSEHLRQLFCSRGISFSDLASDEYRMRIGLNDKDFIQFIRTMSQSIPLYNFADVNKRIIHEALGEVDGLDDYLNFIGVFDGWQSRSKVGSRIKIDDIELYYADDKATDRAIGVLTDDFFDLLQEDTRESLGISEEEFRKITKAKFFDSSVNIDALLRVMNGQDLEGLFEDYAPMRSFLRLYFNGAVAEKDSLNNMTIREIDECFDDVGAKPGIIYHYLCSGVDIERLGRKRFLEIFDAKPPKKIDNLFRGASSTDLIFGDGETEINRNNALAAFARFVKMDANDWRGAKEDDEKVRNAFSEEKVENKNLVLEMLREDYSRYLKGGDKNNEFPFSLRCFSEYVHQKGGAGPLVQIEAFLDYCGELGKMADKELIDGVRAVEKRMKKWDDQERANFYSISAEMMRADRDIFKIFLDDFERIKEKGDFERFAKQIYPLYRAKLSLLKEYDYDGSGLGSGIVTGRYRNVDKRKLIDDLREALTPFTFDGRRKGETEAEYEARSGRALREVKGKIMGEIIGLFGVKFRLKKEAIPEEFNDEMVRAIEDATLYLSNLKGVNSEKQNYLGYMLATQLDIKDGRSAWEALRGGDEVSPEKYMMQDAAYSVASALEKSRENNPVTVANLGLNDDGSGSRLADFKRDLQYETSEIRPGSILTTDEKLRNICENIKALVDPDLYDGKEDRVRIRLLDKYKPDMIRSTARKMHRWLDGREVDFTEDEQVVKREMETALINNKVELTKENVETYFQSGLNELSAVFSAYEKIQENGVEELLRDMQRLLIPDMEIANIFAELGEEFTTGSGVQAISADIEYLDSVIAKADGRLSGSDEERREKQAKLRNYYDEIRDKFTKLTSSYESIVKGFESIRITNDNSASAGRTKLIEKIKEIKDIIGDEVGGSQPTITTICSHHMPTIIENMRACLACKNGGMNNDTNLSFVEGYKFYLYSKGNISAKGSSADEIVFFTPVGKGNDKRMSFVMDKVYGGISSDVYYNHVATMMKKAKDLKARYPEVKISIFATRQSASSCGVSLDEGRLREMVGIPDEVEVITREKETVFVPESGFGDHYIEFGGGERTSGEREVDGIEIIF